ncbi:MAG: hypothetical protein KF715_00015 [Candidatus Didemnitutus sp.]|nr:hypothetical protein [Candidatus Didemnitutus sp.]
MKALRHALSILALLIATAATHAADPSGVWQWNTASANGPIETKLTLALKDGQLTGAYTNQFGDTAISNAALQDAVLTFDVVRNFRGQKYVVHYRGTLAGDTITGTIEAPGHDGGQPVTLPWTAQRHRPAPTPATPPKS